jgi:hypothetical protein
VTRQVLTPQRRDELAALLDDEERLRREYPKVSEYLEMASRLAGTGDARADAAFDLRFVHYVTGGSAHSSNPYWDIVGPSVSERDGRRVVDGGQADGSPRLAYAQLALQAIYAYAIPSPETVEWISGCCGGRRVLELGAGRGYWAGQLAAAGVEVDAYDSDPPDTVENVSFPRGGALADVWHPVSGLEEFSWDGRSEQVLFLCWPPGWGSAMASEVLGAFVEAGGRRVVFIGQGRGGMTGDAAFFDALADGFDLKSEDQRFASWWNLGDVAQAWVRR